MRAPVGKTLIVISAALSAFSEHAYPQSSIEETLSGPDSHETGHGPHGHLLGDWGGVRPYLFDRGVRFDFQYISDNLANVESDRNDRFVSWDRVRGTVDIDFGALIGQAGWYFHATALWQNGGNLGTYLGLLTSPSGMSSALTFRLDSWWLEMKAGGFLDFGVELKNPDFAALAQSAGILGLKAETAKDVRPMLQKALKHDGPALVEVLVHRQELQCPRQSLWNKPTASACSCSKR